MQPHLYNFFEKNISWFNHLLNSLGDELTCPLQSPCFYFANQSAIKCFANSYNWRITSIKLYERIEMYAIRIRSGQFFMENATYSQ